MVVVVVVVVAAAAAVVVCQIKLVILLSGNMLYEISSMSKPE